MFLNLVDRHMCLNLVERLMFLNLVDRPMCLNLVERLMFLNLVDRPVCLNLVDRPMCLNLVDRSVCLNFDICLRNKKNSPELWCLSTNMHGVTLQQTVMLMFTATRDSHSVRCVSLQIQGWRWSGMNVRQRTVKQDNRPLTEGTWLNSRVTWNAYILWWHAVVLFQ
jgi:hypothetical protein